MLKEIFVSCILLLAASITSVYAEKPQEENIRINLCMENKKNNSVILKAAYLRNFPNPSTKVKNSRQCGQIDPTQKKNIIYFPLKKLIQNCKYEFIFTELLKKRLYRNKSSTISVKLLKDDEKYLYIAEHPDEEISSADFLLQINLPGKIKRVFNLSSYDKGVTIHLILNNDGWDVTSQEASPSENETDQSMEQSIAVSREQEEAVKSLTKFNEFMPTIAHIDIDLCTD